MAYKNLEEALEAPGHIVAHCEGGSREKKNLLRMCDDHNMLQASGQLVVEGTADAPVFKDRFGRPIEEYGLFWFPPPGVPDPLDAPKKKQPDVSSPGATGEPPPAPPPAEASPPVDTGAGPPTPPPP